MTVVAVTGACGTIGRRVVARLALDPAVERIVGVDRGRPTDHPEKLEHHRVDLLHVDLKPVFDGVDVVVHLAWVPPARPELEGATANTEVTARVLDAAGAAGVAGLVLASSAAVYGAWPDNPVPLTEDAPVRPAPGFTYAIEKAEAERLVAGWRDAHPGATAAVLRTAPVLGPGEESWLSRALAGGFAVRVRDHTPPAQFVHPDDVAAAVCLAATARLDGAFNVAPSGWIPGADVRAMAGGTLDVPLPEAWVRRIRRAGWRLHLAGTPPTAVPYTLHPWVVANDKLRSAGWQPAHTNEEVLVAGRRGSWWRELSPKRRQEVALAAAGASVATATAAAIATVRRQLRGSAAPR